MRTSFLPFHRPQITEREIEAVAEALRSGWLTTGPRARAFEDAFGRFVSASYAVSLSSGTAALHMALETIGVTAGDEVIVPTMSFAATAEAVGNVGATPVLVDCRPDTLTIDPEAVARALGPRTKAIMAVHVGGHPCDMDALLGLARAATVALIEDAAHALPAQYRRRPIGSIGDFTCFSFSATKTLTTGEGGMLTTEHADHADRVRAMRLHGFVPAGTDGARWDARIRDRGFKCNLSDVAAALGLAQLRSCEARWHRREQIAAAYDAAFSSMPELRVPHRDPQIRHSWHLYAVRLDPDRLTVDRNRFARLLGELHVGTSVHFRPLHQHPYFARRYACGTSFPNADAAFATLLSLPIYPGMTDTDVSDVSDAVKMTAGRCAR